MATIAQISDIHIGGDYERFDTHANFEKVIDDIKKRNIDYLVITGDLADDNYEENYRWIKKKLNKLGKQYFILNGNHDNNEVLRQVFGDYYFGGDNYRNGPSLLFLDTSSGYITEDQLCAIYNNDIVFTHFPIIPVEHKFMNKCHSLILKGYEDEQSSSYSIKRRLENRGIENVTIFCGHYHFDNFKYINKKSVQQFVCPSTQAQLDSCSDELKISCLNPAYRIIRVSYDWELETEVIYLQ